MADTASIAIRRDQAMKRIQDAMGSLARMTDVQPVILPEYDRDPEYLESMRLDVLAGYVESVVAGVEKLGKKSAPQTKAARTADELDAMSKDEVIAEAEAMGMERTSRTTKAEAVDFILAANGVTEEQQAAMDGVTYTSSGSASHVVIDMKTGKTDTDDGNTDRG